MRVTRKPCSNKHRAKLMGSRRCRVVDGDLRLAQKLLRVKERLLRSCFVFGRVTSLFQRLAERSKVFPNGFCRMAQGQIQNVPPSRFESASPPAFAGGLWRCEAPTRPFLIILIRLADRDIAKRPPRFPNDLHELGRFVGRKAVSEDIHAVVLRARL